MAVVVTVIGRSVRVGRVGGLNHRRFAQLLG
jgi:hypothetical protein